MILYHGGSVEISSPDLLHSRKAVDFGVGFYVTPVLEQAEKWSEKRKRRTGTAVISKYGLILSFVVGILRMIRIGILLRVVLRTTRYLILLKRSLMVLRQKNRRLRSCGWKSLICSFVFALRRR